MAASKDRGRRDKHSFFNYLALDRASLKDPAPLGGLSGALVSRDAKSDSQTFLVELPAGWKQEHDAKDACLEFFVLRGDLALEDKKVGASGYVHLPQAGGGGELRSKGGAVALAALAKTARAHGGRVQVRDNGAVLVVVPRPLDEM